MDKQFLIERVQHITRRVVTVWVKIVSTIIEYAAFKATVNPKPYSLRYSGSSELNGYMRPPIP